MLYGGLPGTPSETSSSLPSRASDCVLIFEIAASAGRSSSSDPMQKNMPTLDRVFARSFYTYGCCVYRYRWLFLVTPCLLAVVLSSGIFLLPSRVRKNSVETFTPTDGASIYEKAVINNLFPLLPNRYLPGKFFSIENWVQIIVVTKDRGNFLREEVINASRRFNDEVMHNLSVWSDSLQKNLTFFDLCLRWDNQCFENSHLNLLAMKDNIEEFVRVTYPVTRTVDNPTYLGTSIGGKTFSLFLSRVLQTLTSFLMSVRICLFTFNLVLLFRAMKSTKFISVQLL
ncbi:unnamed protein product [Soboliphyme baturini]|uniref:Patched domain-containing protein 3 n=1 Tax=Soboliphyme baturini TaxID=241478 RepID=A0A183J6U8_9BILA|nr:unnamed protein product [Soboliphyme baturini]